MCDSIIQHEVGARARPGNAQAGLPRPRTGRSLRWCTTVGRIVVRARPLASISRPKISMSTRFAVNRCNPCCAHQDMYCRKSNVYASRVRPNSRPETGQRGTLPVAKQRLRDGNQLPAANDRCGGHRDLQGSGRSPRPGPEPLSMKHRPKSATEPNPDRAPPRAQTARDRRLCATRRASICRRYAPVGADGRSPGRAPPRPLSSRTPTSRCRCATSGRRARARESPPGAGHAASGTESPGGLALALRRASTRGPDRIGGCTEFVRGDVCDGPGLPSGVRGIPCRPAQVSGRAHRMAARRA